MKTKLKSYNFKPFKHHRYLKLCVDHVCERDLIQWWDDSLIFIVEDHPGLCVLHCQLSRGSSNKDEESSVPVGCHDH